VVNVVDLMKLQPPSEHPHRLSDRDFDALFTVDKPIIFASMAIPAHPPAHLPARRTRQHPCAWLQGRGTTSTPFDICVMNDIDRSYLVNDVIDRVPCLAERTAYAKQALRDKQIDHREYTRRYDDMPEIKDWTSGGRAAPARGASATGGDNV
jgi:xylulose-5-phosphate/fructose-6-phosphate phosphoketolase